MLNRFILTGVVLLCFSVITNAQCTQGNGTELVFNGDFELGNTGYSSAYIYCNTQNCLDEGYYAVGVDPTYFHNNFYGADHTTGSGNAMIVNGASVPNTNVWCQTVSVQPYTSYFFSTWVSTMVALSPAQLQFSINGVVLDAPFVAPAGLYDWQQFSATWCSFNDTVATICIVNQNTTLQGNDFALDDISFQPCTFTAPTAISTNAPQCPNVPITLSANSGAGSYNWFPSDSVACDTCASTNAFVTTATTFTLITTYNGCFDTATVAVSVLPAPVAFAGNDTSVCAGQTVQFNAGGGVSFAWNGSSSLSATNIANPVATLTTDETFTVTVTNDEGCTDADAITVTVLQTVAPVVSNDTVVCPNAQVTLVAAGGSHYGWSPSEGLSAPDESTTVATVASTTTFTVTVSNNDGCADTALVTVSVFDTLGTATPNDTSVCYGDEIQLTVNGGSDFTWSGTGLSCSACTNPSVTITQNQVYTVAYSDDNGCARVASFSVFVVDGCAQLVFPNAFTPNGDGLNDLFRPLAYSIASIEYHIYDRWGNHVFTAYDLNTGWDGEYKGNPMPVGTYAWYAKANTKSGETLLDKGNMTLLR